jgi:hypothetical protein
MKCEYDIPISVELNTLSSIPPPTVQLHIAKMATVLPLSLILSSFYAEEFGATEDDSKGWASSNIFPLQYTTYM